MRLRLRPATILGILGVLVLLPGAIGCGSTSGAIPRRFLSPEQGNKYLRVVGLGGGLNLIEAQRGAAANAAGQLINFFGFEGRTESSNLRTELESRLTDLVEQHSPDVRIKGSVLEEWTFRQTPEGYTVYALVTYPRAEIVQEQERLRAARTTRIAAFTRDIRAAGEKADHGDVAAAAQDYVRFITDAAGQDGAETLVEDAYQATDKLISGLGLSIRSGDGQTGSPGASLPEPLVVMVTRSTGGPASGIPVSFKFESGEGELTSEALTKYDGGASCSVSRLEPGVAAGSIRATLDLSKLLGSWMGGGAPPRLAALAQRPNPPAVTFQFAVKRRDLGIKVLVLVDEKVAGSQRSESFMARALQQELWAAGCKVIADVEIGKDNVERLRQFLNKGELLSTRTELYEMVDSIVWGTANTTAADPISSGLYRSFADGDVKMVNLMHGEIQAQVTLNRIAGFDISSSGAEKAALADLGKQAARQLIARLDSEAVK